MGDWVKAGQAEKVVGLKKFNTEGAIGDKRLR